MRAVNKPDKLLLDNPNLFRILCGDANNGSIRESYFVSQVGLSHQVHFFDKYNVTTCQDHLTQHWVQTNKGTKADIAI